MNIHAQAQGCSWLFESALAITENMWKYDSKERHEVKFRNRSCCFPINS